MVKIYIIGWVYFTDDNEPKIIGAYKDSNLASIEFSKFNTHGDPSKKYFLTESYLI